MTEGILIAESEDTDRSSVYWEGLEIRTDNKEITVRSEDWPCSYVGYLSHEIKISWADLLKHAPVDVMIEELESIGYKVI